jgi:hypothetical protein
VPEVRKQRESRWLKLSKRALIGVGIALVMVFFPCARWTPDVFTNWQVPIAVFFLIIYMGVILFDTLFFDRYH